MAARRLSLGRRTLVMGVINVTPDSFWPASRCPDAAAAAATARRLVAEGADLLDVGGQSTRPGAAPLPAAEELERVLGAVRAVRAAVDCPLSIDTFHAEVAAAAVAAGADLVNDVSGLTADPAMAATVARLGVPLIAMDRTPLVPEADAPAAVLAHWRDIRARARQAGVRELVLDPGFGFGKTPAQNLALVRDVHRLQALGHPVCLGVSRKGTIGKVLGGLPVEERLEGSLALAALAAAAGVAILRVHDVRATVRVVRMVEATLPAPPAWLRWEGDEIRIDGIAADGVHGVLPSERERPQPFRVDVTLRLDLGRAGRSDDLAQTVNYAEVAEAVRGVVTGPSHNLIESLAETIAARLLQAYPAREVEVRVHKPQAPVGVPFGDVSVMVRRSR